MHLFVPGTYYTIECVTINKSSQEVDQQKYVGQLHFWVVGVAYQIPADVVDRCPICSKESNSRTYLELLVLFVCVYTSLVYPFVNTPYTIAPKLHL